MTHSSREQALSPVSSLETGSEHTLQHCSLEHLITWAVDYTSRAMTVYPQTGHPSSYWSGAGHGNSPVKDQRSTTLLRRQLRYAAALGYIIYSIVVEIPQLSVIGADRWQTFLCR